MKNSLLITIAIAGTILVGLLIVPAYKEDKSRGIEKYTEDMLTGDYKCVVHGPVTQTLWVANLPRCQKCVSAAFPPLVRIEVPE